MFATLSSQLRRLDGRPRKLAALVCLVLAAVSALHPAGGRTASHQPTHAPAPGQVAVALTLADAGAGRDFLRPGEHIDLLSGTGDISLADVEVLEVAAHGDRSSLLSSSAATSVAQSGTGVVVAIGVADIAKATALTTRPALAAPHAPG